MSGAGIVPATNSLGRHLSGAPNFQAPDVPTPNVQEPNVLAGKCPWRKKSERQLSETPNVRREMSGAGIVPASKCLKRQLSQVPIFQAPNVPAPFVSRQRAAAKCTTTLRDYF